MKRVYIAIVLLTVITIGCIAAIMVERRQLKDMIAMTQQMEQHFRDGETEEARTLAETLADEFSKRTRPFALFLHHSVLADIEECVILLPLYLESDERDDFLAEVSRCRLLLEKQLQLEMPSWENVF